MYGAAQNGGSNLSRRKNVIPFPVERPEFISSSSIQSSSNHCRGLQALAKLPLQCVISYREFIQKYRVLLRFAEDGLSRLVLYAPTRFVAHMEGDIFDEKGNRKILPETLYALIHLWSLLNDVLYHGCGEGNGFTVGALQDKESCDDVLSSGENETKVQQFSTSAHTTTVLRSILSIVECLSPALEVSAYYRNARIRSLDQTMKRKNADWILSKRRKNALEMSAKVETVKFICRLGLVAAHYSTYLKRMASLGGNHEKMMKLWSGMGILQYGGGLDPNEHVTSTKCENDRVKKLLYVGRRTGKQCGVTNRNRFEIPRISSSDHPQGNKSLSSLSLRLIGSSPSSKMLMIMAGELLHIYRPFYFIQSLLKHKRDEIDSRRKKMLKSWILSLLMDVLSQKLTLLGKTVHRQYSMVDTSSESTKIELYHRKMKWVLYLLRAPVWDMMTHPLLEIVGDVMDYVPFIGKPLARYIVDVVSYWEKWHFMTE